MIEEENAYPALREGVCFFHCKHNFKLLRCIFFFVNELVMSEITLSYPVLFSVVSVFMVVFLCIVRRYGV